MRPARLPKRRNSVPLPTPAAAAMSSVDTASGPRSAINRRAASISNCRLRAASPRSDGAAAETVSSVVASAALTSAL
jgi:hypothetical protein